MSDPLLSDWDLWAIATYLEAHLGDQAPFFITERLLGLAQQGDEAGVITWLGVSDRYDQLRARRLAPMPIQ